MVNRPTVDPLGGNSGSGRARPTPPGAEGKQAGPAPAVGGSARGPAAPRKATQPSQPASKARPAPQAPSRAGRAAKEPVQPKPGRTGGGPRASRAPSAGDLERIKAKRAAAEAKRVAAAEEAKRVAAAKEAKRVAAAKKAKQVAVEAKAQRGMRLAALAAACAGLLTTVIALPLAPSAVEAAYYQAVALIVPVLLLTLLMQLRGTGVGDRRTRVALATLLGLVAAGESATLWALADGDTNTISFALSLAALAVQAVLLAASAIIGPAAKNRA